MMNTLPLIIQGGMGVAISDYRLANAVSRTGQLGVISGTGIAMMMAGRLMNGDTSGDVRRALAHFPYPDVAERVLEKYYQPEGRTARQSYKRLQMWTLNPSRELQIMTVVANFVEVWLAREGHHNPVGINLLEKVQMPNMASLYGAMLASVSVVIMGAGVPLQVGGILDRLAHHEDVSYRLDVHGATADDDYSLKFSPTGLFPEINDLLPELKRPMFFPIVSSVILAQALLKRTSGRIDGFVVELPTAGGHNAPPRGQMVLNEQGEPVYGERDTVDIAKIRALGLPFWMAGSYGTPERLKEVLAQGASGIQVGTAFAFCDESGMTISIKKSVIGQVKDGTIHIKTDPIASPTGFPFKVVGVEGTTADPSVYGERERICDVGYLRHLYKNPDSSLGYRCPAEPVQQYVNKGGDEADTKGRMCLCNQLGAAAGFAQVRSDGYEEPALVTSGDDVVNLGRFLPQNANHYGAKDVIEVLLG